MAHRTQLAAIALGTRYDARGVDRSDVSASSYGVLSACCSRAWTRKLCEAQRDPL